RFLVDAEPSRPSTNGAALLLLKDSFVEFRYALTHLLIVNISRSPTSPVLALVYLSSSLFRLLKGLFCCGCLKEAEGVAVCAR
ncbi:hypothetical protein NL299_28025, partial [Klebsiella pneumoniae]|nr:hypothetical protein [Klebsiella pneumoniae]